jgi:hypothetical protein
VTAAQLEARVERAAAAAVRIDLREAKLCLDCDTVHRADSCPACAGRQSMALAPVLNRPAPVELPTGQLPTSQLTKAMVLLGRAFGGVSP